MSDPREIGPMRRKDTRSDLLKAQSAAIDGEKVNFCPFKCESKDLDDHGYCRHLIGFTNDGNEFEPMVRAKRGRRIVRVAKVGTGDFVEDVEEDDDGKPVMVREEVSRSVLEPVLKTDVLVRISTSSRVYRDVPKAEIPKRTVTAAN